MFVDGKGHIVHPCTSYSSLTHAVLILHVRLRHRLPRCHTTSGIERILPAVKTSERDTTMQETAREKLKAESEIFGFSLRPARLTILVRAIAVPAHRKAPQLNSKTPRLLASSQKTVSRRLMCRRGGHSEAGTSVLRTPASNTWRSTSSEEVKQRKTREWQYSVRFRYLQKMQGGDINYARNRE